jgi:hypothetical protein
VHVMLAANNASAANFIMDIVFIKCHELLTAQDRRTGYRRTRVSCNDWRVSAYQYNFIANWNCRGSYAAVGCPAAVQS